MPMSMHVDDNFTGDLIQIAKVAQSQDVNEFWYPPLFYYTTNLYQKVSLSGCQSVIDTAVNGTSQTSTLIANPEIFCTLWSLKFWYLIFDLGVAYLLWRMFRDDKKKSRIVLLFWLLNPIIIYNAYIHGQFDVLPLFFVVLALYLAKQDRPTWAVFSIGIAASLKIYPLLFIPPAVLILSQSWRERIKLLLTGTVPFILSLLPFIDEYGRNASGYGDWFFRVGYDIGFGGMVYVFFALYAVLLWYVEHKRVQGFEALWRVCFITLLIYYPFSYFDLHYYAWLMPFAALYLAENPKIIKLYLFAFLCLLILLFQTPVASFFAPISPKYFLQLPSLLEVLSPHLPILFIMNIFRSFLVGTLFWLAWLVIRDMPSSKTVSLSEGEKP